MVTFVRACQCLERLDRGGEVASTGRSPQGAHSARMESDEEKTTFVKAVDGLRSRIDLANKAAAAQDFRHTAQTDSETVSDFVRRLEKVFRVAYGRDGMSNETRDMLLYCQVQEGLRYELMKAPAVSLSDADSDCTCLAAGDRPAPVLSDFLAWQSRIRWPSSYSRSTSVASFLAAVHSSEYRDAPAIQTKVEEDIELLQ